MFVLLAFAAVILILTPIVLVHEMGHFLAARLCHIEIEEFGLGLPPRAVTLFKRNGTIFSLNWVPLGGFVRPSGENDPTIAGGLAAAPPLARLFVLGAGAAANFLLAFVALWVAFLLGPTATRITAVYPNSPAAEAGLQSGDIFLEIDSTRIESARMMVDELFKADGQAIEIIISRDGETISLITVPRSREMSKANQQPILGVDVEQTTSRGYLRRSPKDAATEAIGYVKLIVESTLSAPQQLASGELSPSDVRPMSIVGIGQLAGRVTANSFITGSAFPVLLLMGLISAALGLTQLLPLPALDGGRMVFVFIELIRGQPIKPSWETAVHRAGMYMLLLLMVVLILQDIFAPILF